MPDASLTFERCLYIGNILGGIIYGLELYIAFNCMYLLLHDPSRSQVHRNFYITYVIVMMLSQTISFASNAGVGQLMWIEHRDFPGGPIAYFNATSTDWNNVIGTIFIEVTNFMGDLLLLYRCYIVWGSYWPVIAFPVIMFLASTTMAIIALVQSAVPGTGIFTQASINFLIPWISLTCGLNVCLTALISLRLLTARRRLLRANISEAKDLTSVYTSVIAILIESALPFSALGIIFAVLLGKQVTVYVIFSVFWGAYAGLAPLLIIHRVAVGKAWSRKTANHIVSTEIKFAGPMSESTLHAEGSQKESTTNMYSSTTRLEQSDSSLPDRRVVVLHAGM
ncbi:hypothetical protein K435DRAFT_779137 [Dendrothele bispora CBS 962.96]|uniref:Uncharacterized protein n=1 Tax=Dendrothele bispora (strain CBS 962.96) TaxID=1314807 RepID=A0A4S8M0H5_DENBC|nr:hypothetical protein K435DRAFT_779137 [Dendrothele bispora CBS 962.96]